MRQNEKPLLLYSIIHALYSTNKLLNPLVSRLALPPLSDKRAPDRNDLDVPAQENAPNERVRYWPMLCISIKGMHRRNEDAKLPDRQRGGGGGGGKQDRI